MGICHCQDRGKLWAWKVSAHETLKISIYMPLSDACGRRERERAIYLTPMRPALRLQGRSMYGTVTSLQSLALLPNNC